MRKHGRRARRQWTSPTAANGDILRDRIKYIESRLADLERRGFDNAAFHSTQGEKLEPSQAFPSRSEAGTLENVQAESLDITAVPTKRKRPATYLDDPLSGLSRTASSPIQHHRPSKHHKKSHQGEVDAMVGAMPDCPYEQGFFGSSGAANFIKQVIGAKVFSPDGHRPEPARGQ
jgi:hypothetical protein